MAFQLNGRTYELQSCGKPRCMRLEEDNSVRLELRPGDMTNPNDTGERCEVFGWDRFKTSVSVEFDLNVEPSIAANTASWLLLNQFHQDVAGSPPIAFEMAGEEFRIVSRSLSQSYVRQFTDSGFQRGRWYWFKIKATFSQTAGTLDIWRDNQKIVTYSGPLGFNAPQGGYWKSGIYRASSPETMIARYRGLIVSGT